RQIRLQRAQFHELVHPQTNNDYEHQQYCADTHCAPEAQASRAPLLSPGQKIQDAHPGTSLMANASATV
ncbi:hypothetical protein AZZ95_003794, partial [Enterobacter roggenkampii]